jgi:CheY-like chemotaxis protein
MTHKHLLIVEDDEDIRDSLRDAFEDEGYLVKCAGNGVEGLDVLRTFKPCAVVLDLLMPIMNGIELYAAMRADPSLSAIPVVISTSDPSRAPSGAVLVPKPVDVRDLLTNIERLCQPA